LSLDNSDIVEYFKELEGQQKQIKHDLLKICWYMRGGVTYHEALMMGSDEKKIIADIIKDNLETTKKTGQPFF
jgi:hypothetical protein